MPDETIDSGAVTDSAVDSPVDTQVDTSTVQEHANSEVDEATSHVEWLRSNIDKLPEDTRRELGKSAQPEFNRHLNQLNLISQQREANAQAALKQAGVELPTGKSVSDLLYEDGGKGFTDLLRTSMQKELGPVKDAISKAEMNTRINQGINAAQQYFPETSGKHWQEAVRVIDASKDLSIMAMENNAAALPYVVDYVSRGLALDQLQKENKDYRAKLEGTKVLAKTGTSSTKSTGAGGSASNGSGTSRADREKPGGIENAWRRAALAASQSNK